MKGALPGLLLLAALLVVPFMLAPKAEVEPATARRLVILTPHNDAIRYEMTRGFKRYLQARGQAPVRLDWRSPGGTTELSRYLSSEYRSAFEHYFLKQTGHPLSERGAMAFANPKQSAEG
ncbi:MAG TPA: hypothetical protein VNG33_13690, partial [Polyangiaceae bacterium]|nr:hypothetical protein [Polyangiaceae bacterium]